MPVISSRLITPTVSQVLHGVGDVLAGEDVLDGLVLEHTAAGLVHGGLGELAVLVQRGDGGLLDDVVDVVLGQVGILVQRQHGPFHEALDLGAVGGRAVAVERREPDRGGHVPVR